MVLPPTLMGRIVQFLFQVNMTILVLSALMLSPLVSHQSPTGIPAGIWRFCPGRDGWFGRDFSRDFRCITSEKFTPTMPQLCPVPQLCPEYVPTMPSVLPQLCINIGPSSHIILSCIENHKFIINKTNGYEKSLYKTR